MSYKHKTTHKDLITLRWCRYQDIHLITLRWCRYQDIQPATLIKHLYPLKTHKKTWRVTAKRVLSASG